MADSATRRNGAADDPNGGNDVPTVDTSADRVRDAEAVVLLLFADAPERDATELVREVTATINDPSIASLAVWELLDRGTLAFMAGSRRRIQRVS